MADSDVHFFYKDGLPHVHGPALGHGAGIYLPTTEYVLRDLRARTFGFPTAEFRASSATPETDEAEVTSTSKDTETSAPASGGNENQASGDASEGTKKASSSGTREDGKKRSSISRGITPIAIMKLPRALNPDVLSDKKNLYRSGARRLPMGRGTPPKTHRESFPSKRMPVNRGTPLKTHGESFPKKA